MVKSLMSVACLRYWASVWPLLSTICFPLKHAGALSSKVHLPTANFPISLTSNQLETVLDHMWTVFTSLNRTLLITVCCCCCCRWSSNLLSWMRDSAPSVWESAHGRGDNIITMVTTGCGPSRGMEGEIHTDANSPRGTRTHIPHRNKYSHTYA